MSFTQGHARLLWEYLPDDMQKAFKFLSGVERQSDKQDAPIEAINGLFEYGLIVREKDFISGKPVVVLTKKGKTLAKAIA